MPRSRSAARWLLLASAALLAACSEAAGPTLERRQPLVTFRPDPAFRVAAEGAWEMRWLRAGGGTRRAFVCDDACALRFRLGAFAGGRLELVASAAPGRGAARLEVRAGRGDGAGDALFEAELAAGGSRVLDLPLPTGGDAWVRLSADPPSGAASALFVEPTLVAPRSVLPAREGSPNVVLITSDTTRQDELGVYGGPVRTPAIDRLAAEGVAFDDAHAVAFATNPSHASLMTSTHAATHGVDHNAIILGTTLPTLAEVLGEGGYGTAAFVSAVVLTHRAGLGRGFDLYDDTFGVERRGDLTVSLFEQWLDAHAPTPFFAWIHLYDPHQPYAPPEGYADPYLEGVGDERVARVDEAVERVRHHDREGFIEARRVEDAFGRAILPDLERVARARYRGEIAFVDEQVGRVTSALEGAGLLEKTIVVFTSDHGENFLDRGTAVAFDHTGIRGDVSRVPLVVRLPGGRGGRRSDALVATLDLAPTLAALAGVDAPPSWTGRRLFSRDGELGEDGREDLILESSHRREIGVRTRAWLYRQLREWAREDPRLGVLQGYAPGRTAELYDRGDDPDEREDAYRPDDPRAAVLRDRIAEFDAGRTREPASPLRDPDQLRALEALGYVEGGSERAEP